ncbi:MAG: DNA-directed RNA polymerase subunit omega [Acidobacteria bacterium]|nr:MAG: DNA-directed RNA polymerase subunit omega [Acidobacteriota bacterium]
MELPNNIDSKFRYILIAAKRARQLQSGVRPLVQTQTKRATKIAQQEVSSGLIPFEVIQAKAEDGNN